jgi:hypothetical protein
VRTPVGSNCTRAATVAEGGSSTGCNSRRLAAIETKQEQGADRAWPVAVAGRGESQGVAVFSGLKFKTQTLNTLCILLEPHAFDLGGGHATRCSLHYQS